ncbi:MAG: DUF4167 domain-containing protein [Alphaproteobacteria bacterium]
MKKSSKQRGRSYGRNNNNNNNFRNINACLDSNGPGGRIRGTLPQLIEKYMLMARDANAQNDKILAENYYQYAEHYTRIINSFPAEVREHRHHNPEDKKVLETSSENQENLDKEHQSENLIEENVETLSEELTEDVSVAAGKDDAANEEDKKIRRRRTPRERPLKTKIRKIKEEVPEGDMIKEIGFLTTPASMVTTAAE